MIYRTSWNVYLKMKCERPFAEHPCSAVKALKKRIFVYVREEVPCKILVVSEDGREFWREVEQTEDLWGDASPAARAFEALERFCVEECGLTDCNDEVIFARRFAPEPETIGSYIDCRLGGVGWAVAKSIEFGYGHETAHLASPMSFEQFVRSCDIGLAEPYATRHLYAEYRRLIHKDSYTPQELDRLESYVYAHLDEAYSPTDAGFNAVCSISHACAATYHSDVARFLQLTERIVMDGEQRCGPRSRRVLADILMFTAEEIADDGYIDYEVLAAEEGKPPLERNEYAIFRAVAPEQLKIIKNILEEYDL